MKYIRTKDSVYDTEKGINDEKLEAYFIGFKVINYDEVIKEADTPKELCDCFVVVFEDKQGIVYDDFEWAKIKANENLNAGIKTIVYGAIWTDKGPIYVTQMNDKGDLKLI